MLYQGGICAISMYLLYKACDNTDGTLDWAWAKSLVEDRMQEITNERAVESRLAAELEKRGL